MNTKASYKALVPVSETICVVSDPAGEIVCGRNSPVVSDIFSAYYASLLRPHQRGAPHLDFVNTHPDLPGVMAFTAKWGPLILTEPDSYVLNRCQKVLSASGDVTAYQCFAFHAKWWKQEHRRYKQAWTLLGEKKISKRREAVYLWPRQPLATIGPPAGDTGGFAVIPDFGTPIGDLARFWVPKYARNREDVRRQAKQLNIFVPEKGKTGDVMLKLVAITLLDALWLMLSFDIASSRFGTGLCESCGDAFAVTRGSKRYCGHSCAQRAASLRHYHRKGKQRRRGKAVRK
jgi:hypothetical protein